MADSLDMSTASLISQPSRSASDSTADVMHASAMSSSIPSVPSPPSPRSVVLSESEARLQQQRADVPYPNIDDSSASLAPSSSAAGSGGEPSGTTAWRVARTTLNRVAHFIFKDNNLPLLVNVLYHLAAARSLMLRPARTIDRYIHVPVMQRDKKPGVVAAASLATDALRLVGAMHLALGLLAGLGLKERRVAAEKAALLVLTLASAGQAWAHARGYWESSRYYTLRALQEIGSLDTGVLLINAIALSHTARRTGRWL